MKPAHRAPKAVPVKGARAVVVIVIVVVADAAVPVVAQAAVREVTVVATPAAVDAEDGRIESGRARVFLSAGNSCFVSGYAFRHTASY